MLGEVTGNVTASEKVDIRDNGSVDGDVTSPRVAIAEGAHFRGAIDMQRNGRPPSRPPRTATAPAAAAPGAGQGRRLDDLAARRRAPASALRSLLWLADCTISCPGSADVAVSRREHPTAPAAADAPELVYPTKALPKFLANIAVKPAPVLLDLGPGRRQQRVVLRRGTRLPDPRRRPLRRHRAARRGRHARPAAGVLPHPLQERAGHASTASCAGTCSTILDRAAATALAGDAGPAAGGRRLAARLLQHVDRAGPRALHEVHRRRSRHAALPHLRRPRRRGSAACRIATSSSCSRRLRVSDSFLMKTNMREIIFRKPAYLAGL